MKSPREHPHPSRTSQPELQSTFSTRVEIQTTALYSSEPESNPALRLVKLKEEQSMKEHEVAMGFSAQLSAAALHTALGPIFDDGLILVLHCPLSPGLVERQGQYT